MIYIILIMVGFIIGFIPTFLIMKRHNFELDESKLNELKKQEDLFTNQVVELQEQKVNLINEKLHLLEEIQNLENEAKHNIHIYYEENYRKINRQLDEEKNQLEEQKTQWKKEYENEYLTYLSELIDEFNKRIDKKRKEFNNIEDKLFELESLMDSAVEARKREAEKEAKQDFYRIVLSENDLNEINQLRQVATVLRDQEPINKVIWKIYYEKPTNDLIGRVIGPGVHTGIYKITNLQNQMCYIGQAADLASRWKQHIKRGLGADTPTKNKLYPAMASIGVENFSFEVVEECERSQLNAREDYWQQYFHAIDYGYSIK